MNEKVEGAEPLRSIKMTAKEFAKTHKTDPDWVVALGDRQIEALVPGQRGVYGGETAVVERHYHNGMYEIGLPGGSVYVDGIGFVASPVAAERPVASDRERLLAKMMLTAASEAPNPEGVSISSQPGGLWDNPMPLEQLKALKAGRVLDSHNPLLRKLPFTVACINACENGFDLSSEGCWPFSPISIASRDFPGGWQWLGVERSPSPSNEFWDDESNAELSRVEGRDLYTLSREELRLAIAIATFQHDAQTFKYKFDEVDPGFDVRLATGEKRFFDVSIYSGEFEKAQSRLSVATFVTSRVAATIVAADDQSIDSMLRYGLAKAAELSVNDGLAEHGYKDLCVQLAYEYGLPEGSWREVLTVLCDAPSYQEPRVGLPPMNQTLAEKLDVLLQNPLLSASTRKSILEYQTRSPKTITSALSELKEAKPRDNVLADCYERIAKGIPSGSGDYARGYRDAVESMTLFFVDAHVQAAVVLDAVETALDAYGNHVSDDVDDDDDDVVETRSRDPFAGTPPLTALEQAIAVEPKSNTDLEQKMQ